MITLLNIVKALADGNRMRVVAALMRYEELCVCQIVELLKLSTPTVSRHMAVLQGAGLVKSRKDGRWVFYSITENFPNHIQQWFEKSLLNTEEIIKDQAALGKILETRVEELCRGQKERKDCPE